MTLLSVYIEYYNYELQKGIGLIAINDSFWIESTIYKILKKYFRNDPYYINVVELFHEVCDLKSHFCVLWCFVHGHVFSYLSVCLLNSIQSMTYCGYCVLIFLNILIR